MRIKIKYKFHVPPLTLSGRPMWYIKMYNNLKRSDTIVLEQQTSIDDIDMLKDKIQLITGRNICNIMTVETV